MAGEAFAVEAFFPVETFSVKPFPMEVPMAIQALATVEALSVKPFLSVEFFSMEFDIVEFSIGERRIAIHRNSLRCV